MSLAQPMMEFYGLREEPFAATADPAYFYASRELKECLFRIWASIEGGYGPVVVLGAPGAGKTVVMRKLLVDMPQADVPAVIASPHPDWSTPVLLQHVLDRFGLRSVDHSPESQFELLSRYLLDQSDRRATLIIDDAQNLTRPGQLELLRLTQNIESPQRKLLNVVIFAESGWTRALRRSPGFLQRVNTICTLQPLGLEDVRGLIAYRLRRAGVSDPETVFSDEAVTLIHRLSGGVPRAAVTLCRNTMLIAGRLKARPVQPDMVLYTFDRVQLPEEAPEASDGPEAVEEPVQADGPSIAEPTADEPLPAGASEPEAPASPAGRSRTPSPLAERANQLLLKAMRKRPE